MSESTVPDEGEQLWMIEVYVLMQTGHLCSRVLQHQVSDAGLHGDVGSDQQLQRTDR